MNKKKKQMLNKILNQNADISYDICKTSSVSVKGRPDVQKFQAYIKTNYKNGKVLDLGCGPLAWPDYLPKEIAEPFGIDPKPSKFRGKFTQCMAEELPFDSNSFDTVICATSLDHMLDLGKAISEVSRTLSNNGRFVVWCNKDLTFKTKVKVSIKKHLNYIRPKYWQFDEGYVFEIPRGAVDPFHIEYIPPKKIIRWCVKYEMVKLHSEVYEGNLFLCFEKRR